MCDIPKVPHVPASQEEIAGYPLFPFPDLEKFESTEWKKTGKKWFVDSTGCGGIGERALTVDQFKTALHQYHKANPSHGFGITGQGQFQVYVSAFAPTCCEPEEDCDCYDD